jgi:hypothetical protein
MSEIMNNGNEEFIKVTGHLKVYLNGELVCDRPNTVTNAGKARIASLLNSASAGNTFVQYMGFGTGTTAAAGTDTSLVTELTSGTNGYARKSVAITNPSSQQIQYVATLSGITAQTTINEVGLFDTLSSNTGVLSARQIITNGVTLSSSSDSLQITWQINLS